MNRIEVERTLSIELNPGSEYGYMQEGDEAFIYFQRECHTYLTYARLEKLTDRTASFITVSGSHKFKLRPEQIVKITDDDVPQYAAVHMTKFEGKILKAEDV